MVNAIKKYITEADVPQSDWLVNDESNPAFIKNKPFYTTDPTEVTIIPEMSVTFYPDEMSDTSWVDFLLPYGEGTPIIIGQTYSVNWNGTIYECVGTPEGIPAPNGEVPVFIGNPYISNMENENNNIPFLIYYFDKTNGCGILKPENDTTVTVSVTTIMPIDIKIDEKYLPDSVGKSTEGTIYNIDGEEVIANYGAEIFNNYENNIASGYCSHAEGSNTIASGAGSHTEGLETIATKEASHAEGLGTTASGNQSHAEGSSTKAIDWSSHAEGIQTTASGEGSHAEGRQTTASGKNSHAEGGALSNTGTTISDKIITSSDYSGVTEDIAVKGPISYGIQSHAEGTQTLAFEYSSHAEGYQTLAFGYSSHTEGFQTRAYGDYSHAEGDNTKASGDYGSHAEGYHTIASGQYSHAEGSTTTAYGSSSHAEGYYTTASGSTSHAEGFYTRATGYNSHAEGNRTLASGQYQHVQGKYNIDDVDAKGNALHTYAHIVGNGESDYARSNAHTLDWDGNAWFAGDVTATDAEGNSVSILSLLIEINNLKAELATLKATYAELTETDANALVEEVFN